jgi:hypothetical protein
MRTLLALLLLIPTVAWCQWKVEVEWDEMTDHRSATASTKSAEGHRLFFWFPKDGGARITVNLARGEFEFTRKKFHKEQLPIYRVDSEPPVDLNNLASQLQVRVADEAMGWKMADRRSQPSGSLVWFLAGKRMLLRYFDDDGEQHDISFPLQGAERAYKLAAELQQ